MTKQEALKQINEWHSQQAHLASDLVGEVVNTLNQTAPIAYELTQEEVDGGVSGRSLFEWVIANSALGGF